MSSLYDSLTQFNWASGLCTDVCLWPRLSESDPNCPGVPWDVHDKELQKDLKFQLCQENNSCFDSVCLSLNDEKCLIIVSCPWRRTTDKLWITTCCFQFLCLRCDFKFIINKLEVQHIHRTPPPPPPPGNPAAVFPQRVIIWSVGSTPPPPPPLSTPPIHGD